MYSGDELASGLVVAATKPLLQPIYRLHIELLEMIFNTHVDWLIERYRSTQDFIPCTHVCHTWRAVALSSARLWRYIDFTRPKTAKEFLVRSKQAPICIMTPFDTEPFGIGSGEILHQHAERIREIDVFLEHHNMRGFLTHLDFALPALSALSLQVYVGASDLNFTCAIPNVRTVNLSGVALPWDSCTNLTELSIGYLGVACSPSASQILTIMMQCPALEAVYLDNIHPVMGAATILQTPIKLLHLHTLELDLASDHIILHILSCISIPSFATISIFSPISSLASVIPRHTQHLHNISCDEVSILYLSTSILQLCQSPHNSQGMLSVAISEMSDTTLSSFTEIFDPSRVVTLEIDEWETGYIMPHSFLTALTCLTTLNVDCAGSEFFGSLTQPQETPSSTLQNDIICPQLKTVIIGHFINTAETRLDSLIAWLKQRNELGVRLHRLELNECEVSQYMMDQFRLLVDEMVVRESEDELEEGASL